MPQRSAWFLLPITLAVVLMSCADDGDSSAAAIRDTSADEVAIRALLAINEAATNRRDSAGVAATFVDELEARSSWIAKRQNGEWRIAAVRVMSIEDPP